MAFGWLSASTLQEWLHLSLSHAKAASGIASNHGYLPSPQSPAQERKPPTAKHVLIVPATSKTAKGQRSSSPRPTEHLGLPNHSKLM